MKNDEVSQKKRRSDEHREEKKAKRVRKDSNEEEQPDQETDDIPATSDVEDVVDDIFGKDVNDDEVRVNDLECTRRYGLLDQKSTRLNSSHITPSRMPSSA